MVKGEFIKLKFDRKAGISVFFNHFYFLILTYFIFSIMSSKRYSTTGKVKPGICIIGQLPIMVDKT